ncbi:MAG: hypothetical protein IPM91_02265 [Bacteroidetes bacterium]|nr:hypothetical protein [Bacteroidota bacterium]
MIKNKKTQNSIFIVVSCLLNSIIVLAQGTWVQKANLGGTIREGGVGLSINGKGYFGMGEAGGLGAQTDFWEYDHVMNSWTQKQIFQVPMR